MLMVNHGWLDNPTGANGASLLVRWSDVFERMHALNPERYSQALDALLAGAPHPDGATRPVAYPLPSARSTFDLGVRLKSDLLEHLQTQFPNHPSTQAVQLLTETANDVARRVQLHSGDLLLLDNNRWGHGRESIIGRRQHPSSETELNPRELWSVTIG
jgi:hypothetical protein